MKEWLSKVAVMIVSVLAPIHAVMISVGVLIFSDLVTGVWAAIKRGEHIKSSKLRNSVSKLIIYQIAIISGFVFETYLIGDLMPITKIVAGIIGLVEIKSIFENLNVIYGSDLFKVLINKLGSTNNELNEQGKKE